MNKHEFHHEQYRDLRAEALKHVDETRSVEKYALLGIGGYYAFMLGQWDRISDYTHLVWWLPVGLAVCGGVRSLALFLAIGNNAKYLRKLERTFCAHWAKGVQEEPKLKGWENFRQHELPLWRKVALMSSLLFWPLLIGGTVWIACLLSKPVTHDRPNAAGVGGKMETVQGDPPKTPPNE